MEPSAEDWARLFEFIKQARIATGFPKRAPFSVAIGINDSTMAIAEGARKGPLSEEMLDFVAIQLGWGRGTWQRVLSDETFMPDLSGPRRGQIKPGDATVLPPGSLSGKGTLSAGGPPPAASRPVDISTVPTDVLLAELAKRVGEIEPEKDIS